MNTEQGQGKAQKDLEEFAKRADSDEVQRVLETCGSQIKKQVLNSSLRASVMGCTTNNQADAIECIYKIMECGANINSEEPS